MPLLNPTPHGELGPKKIPETATTYMDQRDLTD